MRPLARVFAMTVLALLVFSAFLGFNVMRASANTTLTIGVITGTPTTFALDGFSTFIGNQQSDIPYLPIGVVSASGVYTAGIANPPQVVAGSNNTQFTLNLISPNLKWSDGTALNATDLAYSIEVYLPTGPYANLSSTDYNGGIRGTVKSVQVVNSTEVMVTTVAPDAGFPYHIFPYPVYPFHYFKQFTGNNTLETTPILSGPGDSAYIPVGYTAGSTTMNLEANPNSPSWGGRTPGFSNVTIDFFTSDSALVNALASGSIDLASIEPGDVSALNTTSFLTITQVPDAYMTSINVRNVGYPWNNTDFRQALLYAINKEQINSVVYGNNSVIQNPSVLPPSATEWLPSNLPLYSFNTTAATHLLEAAGLTKGSSGWVMPNGTALPAISFLAQNDLPTEIRTAQFLAADWQAIGLSINLQEEPGSQVDAALYSTLKFSIIYDDGGFLPVPWRYAFNIVNFPNGNGGYWSNSTYATLKTEASSAPNPAAQLPYLKQLVLTIAQSAIIDGIVSDQDFVAYNNHVVTNVNAAAQAAAGADFFMYPPFGEAVLTAVTPASTSSSTSTTTSSSTSTTTSSTSSSSIALNPSVVAIEAIAVAVILAAGAAGMTRSRKSMKGPSPL